MTRLDADKSLSGGQSEGIDFVCVAVGVGENHPHRDFSWGGGGGGGYFLMEAFMSAKINQETNKILILFFLDNGF